MKELFLQILNMSLTGGGVILAVLLLRVILHKTPRRFTYLLWLIVAFRLLCPVSISSQWSMFSLSSVETVERAEDGVTGLQFVASQEQVKDAAGTISGPTQSQVSPDFGQNSTPSDQEDMPAESWIPEWIPFLVWVAGMIGILGYNIVSYIRLRRRMVGAIILEENVYRSDKVRAPFILGMLKPRIYIPFGLSPEVQRYVLLHEKYHLERGDHIIKLLAVLILTLHWFNPLCWIAFYLMNEDMEMSCDERVMENQIEIRESYSESLLAFASNRRLPAAGLLHFSECGAKKRIQHILQWKRPKWWMSFGAIMLNMVLLVTCSTNPVLADTTVCPKGWEEYGLIQDSVFSSTYWTRSVSFPCIAYDGYDQHFYGTEPFAVTFQLPAGWVIRDNYRLADKFALPLGGGWRPSQNYGYSEEYHFAGACAYWIYDDNGNCIGSIVFNSCDVSAYGEPENEQQYREWLYKKICTGKIAYCLLEENGSCVVENTAANLTEITKVRIDGEVFLGKEGAETWYNHGIVSRDPERNVFVAMEFNSCSVSSEEVIRRIAESIRFQDADGYAPIG